MLGGRQQEIHDERDRKLEEGAETAPGAPAERRLKKDEYPVRVAGEVDNFRMADEPGVIAWALIKKNGLIPE
jgi:hypothetical protein